MTPRRKNLAIGHKTSLNHVGENFVGAGAGGRQIDMRRIFSRRFEEPGQHCGFGKRNVFHAFTEIKVGRCCDAERAATHISAVEIKLYYFRLGKVGLKPECKKGFVDFTRNSPFIGEEDVLLEVANVGVCGCDLHQWTADHSWPVNYPVVLGHEFAGVIVECGASVEGWKEGDRVTGLRKTKPDA